MATKLSNVIGAPFADYVLRQFAIRAGRNSAGRVTPVRQVEEVLYLANKTAWARLVSSVDIVLPADSLTSLSKYIVNLGIEGSGEYTGVTDTNGITNSDSLAKNWILQSGTSIQNGNGVNLRRGLGPNGAYGLGGTEELGYRPLPGLTSVVVDTVGRLGSLRQATITFKVWNMNQLNTIEALYFRLGYSMLLEWGHTQYYNNQTSNGVENEGVFVQNGVYGIDDPFKPGLRKEDIQRNIAVKREKTSGNYDGMLGVVSNFTWAYNQEGGYDCTVRLVGLGSVMDSTNITQTYKLPQGTIKQYAGAESTIDAFLVQQLNARLAEQNRRIAALERAQNTKPEETDGAGELPRTVLEFLDKVQKFDNFTSDPNNRLTPLYNTYGVNTSTDIEGVTPNQDLYGTFNEGRIGPQSDKEAAKKKFTGLYISTPAAQGVNYSLSFVPDPEVTKTPVQIKLNQARLVSYIGKKATTGLFEIKGAEATEDYTFLVRTQRPIAQIPYVVEGISPMYAITYIISAATAVPAGSRYTGLQGNSTAILYRYVDPASKVYTDRKSGQVTDAAIVTAELNLNYSQEDIYISAGIDITPELDYVPTRQEVLAAVNEWHKSLTLNLDELKFTGKGKKSITIIASTTITVESSYKGPKVDANGNPVTVASQQNAYKNARIKDVNGVPVLLTQAKLTIVTNNPGFILSATVQPPPNTPPPTLFGAGSSGTSDIEIQKPTSDQVESSTGFSSALHAMLTVVQTVAQAEATKTTAKSLYGGRIVPVNLNSTDPNSSLFNLTNSFYRDGVFKDVIGPAKTIDPVRPEFDLTAFAQKGFASELMTDYRNFNSIPYVGGKTDSVDFSKFFTAFAIKFKQNSTDGYIYPAQFPVYISLGYLLAFINSMCLFYDSKNPPVDSNQTGGNDNRPYFYIDFNPETNFCLTAPQQFSIDPLTCLVSANLTRADYENLFPTGSVPSANTLFKPESNNVLTQALDKHGLSFKTETPYRGRTMGILLTTQYLLQILKDFTTSDPQHAVNLYPFLERIMTDVNKCLGGMNLFRVAYRDDTNTVQIQDDQYVPQLQGESTMLDRKEFITTLKNKAIESGQLPIFGTIAEGPNGSQTALPTLGIVREMQFKTVMSTKLASMIAISAQAATGSVNAKDHSELSYLNQYYRDRYKPFIKDQTNGQSGNISSNTKPQTGTQVQNSKSNDQIAAERFNDHVVSIYTTLDLVADKITSAKNYYIERISKIKSKDVITAAAPFIPAELEITVDGISGIIMGNAFTIPKERLPLTLRNEISPGKADGFPKVGFIVNGLTHTIENNQWLTRIKGQMIKLRENSPFGRVTGALANTEAGLTPLTTSSTTSITVSTNRNVNDPASPCYVPPFVPSGIIVKAPTAGRAGRGIQEWKRAFPQGQPKGLKGLLEAQTSIEGFLPAGDGQPATKSYRTNNPGNIGNTEEGGQKQVATLTEGIQLQINLINRIANNQRSMYPPDSTLYQYLSVYAPPCYQPDPKNKPNEFAKSQYNDPIRYTNYVIGYLKGEYGITVTADTKVKDIINIR